jgi:MoxR-like ATPase
MSDIVERLRGHEELQSTGGGSWYETPPVCEEAADEIVRLRAALKEAADELDAYYAAEYAGDHPYSVKKLAEAKASNPARAALTK